MSQYVGFAVLCVLLCCCVIPARSTICWVKPSDDLHERTPLILKANADEFVYPSKCGSKSLRLTFIDGLRAACPGDSISVLGRDTGLGAAALSCYGLTLFGLGGTSYAGPLRSIRCGRVPESELRSTSAPCGANGTMSRIGFAVSSDSFVPSVEEICLDANGTQWTHHRLVPNLTRRRSKLPILGAGGGDDAGAAALWAGLGSWLGRTSTTSTTSTSAPAVAGQIVEARLVPREDMFYRAQQDSTASAVNSVPMYRGVRDGNWRLLEEIARKLASAKKQCTTLDVWTGRYNGTNSTSEPTTTTTPSTTTTTTTSTTSSTTPSTTSTTTPSTTSTTTPSTTTTTTTTMPTINRRSRQLQPTAASTPKFVFKMLVDKQHSRGIVFVTLNDPTVTAITPNEQLCTPRAQCSNLYPQFQVVSRGYTHCCTLADFAPVAAQLGLPTFPDYQPII